MSYTRVDLSHYHLFSAFFFADEAERRESVASPMAPTQSLYEYRAVVMGAVMSSVAFLEAKFAELLVDAGDGPFGISTMGLTSEQCVRLVALTGDRRSLLERYQVALLALGKEPLVSDVAPFRSAALVVRLRNFLVHYSAEWSPVADEGSASIPPEEVHILERRLAGEFGTTGFADRSAPFFPDRCLSAACARWAAESTLAFSDGVSERGALLKKHLRPVRQETDSVSSRS